MIGITASKLLRIEKLDRNKVWSALYYDGEAKAYYVKRFCFEVSDNNPLLFIADSRDSRFIELVDDRHPRMEITFGGKNEGRSPEVVNVEEFIAKKGLGAKGKRVSALVVSSVKFIEGLHLPEDDLESVEENGEPVDIEVQVPADEEITVEAPTIEVERVDPDEPGYEPGEELTLF